MSPDKPSPAAQAIADHLARGLLSVDKHANLERFCRMYLI